MSFVDDQVRHFDALLDRFQLAPITSRKSSIADVSEITHAVSTDDSRAVKLKAVIRALSTTSGSRPLLRRHRLRNLVKQIYEGNHGIQVDSAEEGSDLEWLAAGKATVQLYGIILNALLEQTIPLNESIWYWDAVLGSYTNTALYTLQMSPVRFWAASKEVYAEAKMRYQSKISLREAAEQSTQSLSEGWKEFYQLVQDSINDRSLAQARTRILSPFALSRTEARQKQIGIRRLREQSAAAIGLLVDEGLNLPPMHEDTESPTHEWRTTIAKSVTLLEGILQNATSVDSSISDFEYNVIDSVDREYAGETTSPGPLQLATRLIHILDSHLPEQEQGCREVASQCGKPSRLVRYWIPGVTLLLSGGTLLRILTNRRAEIQTWIREAGATTIDFWQNWVVEPIKRLIGTVRHDENSELAIMSRDSLRTDRESLERMVVDFAVEHPKDGRAYTEAQVIDIRNKVREGDLTPVLRAYEMDMKQPIVGAVRGNLIRALLIQIQKTKVDVEVAMSGIDSLLKSQELLFGMVGIAPGVLISYLVFRWIHGAFGGEKGLRQQQGDTVRLMRNIDRILSNSVATDNGMLSYKDHGLLLCEVHVLRQKAAAVLPGKLQREFLEDISDLMNIQQGIPRQMQVVDRIQWAYTKWLK